MSRHRSGQRRSAQWIWLKMTLSVRCPGAAALNPIELIVHGRRERVHRNAERELSAVDVDRGRRVDAGVLAGLLRGLELVLVLAGGHRLGERVGVEADLLREA